MTFRANPAPVDLDLRNQRRELALDALAKRYSPLGQKNTRRPIPKPSTSFGPSSQKGAAPLFDFQDEDDGIDDEPMFDPDLFSREDETAVRNQQEEEDAELARALEASEREWSGPVQPLPSLDDEKLPVFDSSGDEMEEVQPGDVCDIPISLVPIPTTSSDDDLEPVDIQPMVGPSHSKRSPSLTLPNDDGEFVSDFFQVGRSPSPPPKSVPQQHRPFANYAPLRSLSDVPEPSPQHLSFPFIATPIRPAPSTEIHHITSSDQSEDDLEEVKVVASKPFISSAPRRSPVPIAQPSTPPTIPSSPPPVFSSPNLLPSSPDALPSRPLSPLSIARRFAQTTPGARTNPATGEKGSPGTPKASERTPIGVERAPTTSSVAREAARRQASGGGSAERSRPSSLWNHAVSTSASRLEASRLPSPPAYASLEQTPISNGIERLEPAPALAMDDFDPSPHLSTADKGKARALPAVSPTHVRSSVQLTQFSHKNESPSSKHSSSPSLSPTPPPQSIDPAEVDDDEEIAWSASPTPPPPIRTYVEGAYPEPPSDLEEEEGGVDMNAEEDDYARFLSQVKGKDLKAVQEDLDDEIKALNAQKKKAMRDGDESINQQMVSQIQVRRSGGSDLVSMGQTNPFHVLISFQVMLRLYGIPYITAPMEAEAQCAELALLNLVDGVITDDSDVFLFGAKLCYKNMFNDSKYVECYLSHELDRELALDRDRLVTLAFLLGSDYTLGLPGVGYVTAMEVMAEFPGKGDEGLIEFRNWWLKVQAGKDTDVDTDSKWKKSFVSFAL